MLALIRFMIVGLCSLLALGCASAASYRVDSNWPKVAQPWYFDYPPWSFTVAANGSVYVADSFNHQILQFAPNGEFLRQWGHKGQEAGAFDFPQGIAIASDGTLYVVDTENNRIQQFSAEGVYLSQWRAGLLPEPIDIAITPNNTLYVSSFNNNIIRQFTLDGKFIREWTDLSDGNNEPQLSLAPDGTLYVTDYINSLVRQFTGEGQLLKQIDIKAFSPYFDSPTDVAVAADGKVYIANYGGYNILQFAADGTFLGDWGHFNQIENTWPRQNPISLSITTQGNLYVSDGGYHIIQQFNADGQLINQLGLQEHAAQGQLPAWELSSIAIAKDGSVYIADKLMERIEHFAANGNYLGHWENSGLAPEQLRDGIRQIVAAADGTFYILDGSGSVKQFSVDGKFIKQLDKLQFALNLAPAADGSVYVIDHGSLDIHHFAADGQHLAQWPTSLAGDLTEFSFNTDYGPISIPINDRHRKVTLAADGNLYVRGSFGTRLFSPTGKLLQQISQNGNLPFDNLHSIAVAPDGTVYATDTLESCIRHYSADGRYLERFGNAGLQRGQLFKPTSLAIAPDGSLYVIDNNNHRIQKAVPQP